MSEDIENRIRLRARAIWEREGRPDDRHVEHWLQAEREIAQESTQPPAHLVRNPGMVPNETICGVRRFHRVFFQRCVRCPPILHESFKKPKNPRLPSQSATRPEHRYRLQMKLYRGF